MLTYHNGTFQIFINYASCKSKASLEYYTYRLLSTVIMATLATKGVKKYTQVFM